MESRPLLDAPPPDPQRRKNGESKLLPRPQYVDVPYSAVVEEPGPGLLLEYCDIVRRHRGTLILIAFLGLLASLLLTLPQTPIYQARATLEIQNLNENFLNMRDVSPTTNKTVPTRPNRISRPRLKILQSESVLAGVIVKLNLEEKLAPERDRGRLSAWRNALGLPEWRRTRPAKRPCAWWRRT